MDWGLEITLPATISGRPYLSGDVHGGADGSSITRTICDPCPGRGPANEYLHRWPHLSFDSSRLTGRGPSWVFPCRRMIIFTNAMSRFGRPSELGLPGHSRQYRGRSRPGLNRLHRLYQELGVNAIELLRSMNSAYIELPSIRMQGEHAITGSLSPTTGGN